MATPSKQRARVARIVTERRELFNAIKLQRGCTDCGYRGHPAALDFDHRPGTEKKLGISHAIRRESSLEKILAEVAKCDVVCANCHRIRTWNRGQHHSVPSSSDVLAEANCDLFEAAS